MITKSGDPFVWRGRFVEVTRRADGQLAWSFWRCVRCGRELFDGHSIERGIGPECIRHLDDAQAERLRNNARAQDRAAYRYRDWRAPWSLKRGMT